MNALGLTSLFSFISLHRYSVLLPDLDDTYMVHIHVPDFASKVETVLYESREIALPLSTLDDEILMTVVVDEQRKDKILEYFYTWEAKKYSDATRQYLNYPSEYLRNVLVNILNVDSDDPFCIFNLECYVASVTFPDLNYSEKEKIKITAKLRVWDKKVNKTLGV